jgi:hypothetical protein
MFVLEEIKPLTGVPLRNRAPARRAAARRS